MGAGDFTGRWDYRTLPGNVHVSEGCFIERRECFDRFRSEQPVGVDLGPGVQVFTWTSFNVEPTGQVEIGEDTVLVGAVFMCAERISVGRNVLISYNVTIADSDFHPQDPEQRKRDAIANAPSGDRSTRPALVTAPVTIEDDVWIGIGAIILKGVLVGRGARIGAGAVVSRDVAPGAVVEGNPARARTPGEHPA